MPPSTRQKSGKALPSKRQNSEKVPPSKRQNNEKAPPSKRQKAGKAAGKDAGNGEDTKSDAKSNKRDVTSIPDLEYICMPRPHFDYEAENKTLGNEGLDEDEMDKKYAEEFNKSLDSGIYNQPAAEHKDWKWVIMWNGWKTLINSCQKADYCDPDNFGMYIYNDWYGWGLQEVIEGLLVSFDSERKKKGDLALQWMWSVISGLGIWLNERDLGAFIGNEDGDNVQRLTGLMGYALLTALADVDRANELKPDSQLLDLALVISMFLRFSNGLECYGIENYGAIDWRGDAVAYFKRAGLDPEKGVSGTKELLEKLKNDDDDGEGKGLPRKSAKDPHGWAKRFKEYTKLRGPKIGGTQYDITKFSRAQRAAHAFDGKDPLKNFSLKDLKEGNIDIVIT